MRSARLMFCGVLLACTSSTMILAQAHNAGPNPKPEEQVAQLERDWLAADGKGDTASLRRIISDDFVGGSFDGRVLSKRDVIPEETGPGGFAGATPGETNVRIFGDTGVLMGVINTAGGPPPRQIRVALVCQKRSQGWQLIAAQLTQVH